MLRKRGVKPIEALGADFDPHFHQAVAHEPAEGSATAKSSRSSAAATCSATACFGRRW